MTHLLILLALSAGGIDTRQSAPKFFAKTMDGEKFSNDSLKGKVVLIQFWTTWCPMCRHDQDAVESITEEFSKKGVVVLAVDVGESRRKVADYLRRSPRGCKIVLTEDTNLAAQFGAREFPHYVVLDENGKVAGEQKGAGGEQSLRNLLRRAGVSPE